jgi:hypothetical protein
MRAALVEGDMNVFELRGYTHSQLGGPRGQLALIASLRQDLLRRARTAADIARLLSYAFDRARLANALGVMEELREALSDAASLAAAMTIRERVSDGEVELVTRDGTLVFPSGNTDAAIPLWLDGLACAVITRDSTACEYLANSIAVDCVARAAERSDRPIGNEPFWPTYAQAFIAFVHGQPIAAAHALQAIQQISAGPTGALVREGLAITDVPVLRLIEIVASGAKSDWLAALQIALTRFHQHFADPERAHNLSGYLPLLVLAVCRLAIDRGFPAPQSSPYLPSSLLHAQAPHSRTQLDVRYPRQAILGAEEAHWFLDLQGFPRAGRTHSLTAENNNLIARYEVQSSGGLPPVSAEFAVLDQDEADEHIALALDAGQLLFLAQTFATHVPADLRADASNARVLLDDAVGCVDAALARIPEGSDRVPPASIRSEEGSEILTSEPGRFSRARLTAYREGLRAQLAAHSTNEGSAKPSQSPSGAANDTAEDGFMRMLDYAQHSVDMIRAEAMPLLEALAQDADGSVVATLRPREGDYEKVFQGEAIDKARAAYEQLWSGGFAPPRPRSTQTEIRCAVAPAGMLMWSNELSQRFPGGYESIAASLNPHRVWLAWQYVEPGVASGLSFDGLVWVDDHWVWLPKPHRYLRGAS